MSLLQDQATFMLHTAELIKKASELGFHVSGGELYRTSEQQALHVKNGRSKTMNSQHLKRLAVDLNFFREQANGKWRLTYDREELRALGDFWEQLDDANRWGGNWTSFKDTPHFERRESSTPKTTAASAAVQPAVSAAIRRFGAGLIQTAVGSRCPNQRDDVETLQRLLNMGAAQQRFTLPEGQLKPDGAFGNKTLVAIMAFQRALLGDGEPSGVVNATDRSFRKLCEVLNGELTIELLALSFLRADERDIADLASGIVQVATNRNIDSPLRQAHFLAQIGHESGELRFRAEIANGEAYEGRKDLGNNQAGDGRRFKGRGLIQLTGRANYAEYGRALNREKELLEKPELVESDPQLCVDVAGWYWAKRGLNALADKDDLTAVTRRINGGINGLADRRRLLLRTKSLLLASDDN